MELKLTMKDQAKVKTMQSLLAGKITIEETAQVMSRSVRQVYRMKKSLLEEGVKCFIHKSRGRPSPRRLNESTRNRILKLAQGRYQNINDTHLSELLLEREKISISRESLRTLLREAGIKPKRKRKPSKFRSRRQRKEAFGMMIQIDASSHDWLEGRGPWLTLVGGRDDATNHGWAHFVPAETTWAYLDLMREIISTHGIPLTLYSDKHSIFHSTREATLQEQLKGQRPLTQFGRAMDEFGINIIPAGSPQAKGRVERFWGFAQDRLVVQLRLDGASTIEEANQTLVRWLKSTVNSRFKVPPAQTTSVFQNVPAKMMLDRILCLKDTRTVAKDHTISFEGLTLQIPPSKKFRSIVGKKVQVLQLRDGSIQIIYRGILAATFNPLAVKRLVETKLLGPSNLKVAA